jgi:hypothetical protein
MLRRRPKPTVLAEVPRLDGDGSRPGALGRGALAAFTRLAHDLADAGPVLVSGPQRSGAAIGIAAAATASGQRVALLECDLAEPSLADALGLAASPGLHEYLREESSPPGLLQSLVLAGPAAGRATEPLAVIVAGAPEPNPVALIDSDSCDHAIQKLRKAYELLVIAGPSLDEDPDLLRALAEHAGTTVVAGARSDLPRRPPVEVSGLVLVG